MSNPHGLSNSSHGSGRACSCRSCAVARASAASALWTQRPGRGAQGQPYTTNHNNARLSRLGWHRCSCLLAATPSVPGAWRATLRPAWRQACGP